MIPFLFDPVRALPGLPWPACERFEFREGAYEWRNDAIYELESEIVFEFGGPRHKTGCHPMIGGGTAILIRRAAPVFAQHGSCGGRPPAQQPRGNFKADFGLRGWHRSRGRQISHARAAPRGARAPRAGSSGPRLPPLSRYAATPCCSSARPEPCREAAGRDRGVSPAYPTPKGSPLGTPQTCAAPIIKIAQT